MTNATGTVTLPQTVTAPAATPETVTITRKDGTTFQRRPRGSGAARPRSRSKATSQTFYVLTEHGDLLEFKTEAETLAFVEAPTTADVEKVIKGVELKVSMKAALTVA